eukprot:m.98396 g.98396  ORF g.98396 m.98396 type:complete len:295 (-) comp27062_c0_seq1:145-1029(-)
MSALLIVQKLRDLAKPEENREKIVKDQGCLPGLVLLLDNANQEVVDCAIEALEYLAECPQNQTIMWEELGLVISLNCVIEATATTKATVEKTKRIISLVKPTKKAMPVTLEEATPVTKRSTARRPITKKHTPGQQYPSRTPHSFFKQNANANARTVTLHLTGLRDLHARKVVEETLLGMQGIISFTIDMAKTRVSIRAMGTLSVESICTAIRNTKILDASQVLKGDQGTEVMLSFGATPAGVQEPRQAPKYLDDDEDEEITAAAKAVSLTDGVTTSVTGWMSTAATWASKSLYW